MRSCYSEDFHTTRFALQESFGPSTRKVDEYWRSSLPPAHRPAPDEEQLPSGGPRLYDLDSTIHDSVDPSSVRDLVAGSIPTSCISQFVHALLRTSSMPLGPNLGSYSVDGVYDQKFPLVGMDRVVKENTVTGTKTTGYWPLFGALTAGVIDTGPLVAVTGLLLIRYTLIKARSRIGERSTALTVPHG